MSSQIIVAIGYLIEIVPKPMILVTDHVPPKDSVHAYQIFIQIIQFNPHHLGYHRSSTI